MAYTLGEAARATGKAKPTILSALRKGKISGHQDDHGHWQIEPAELHRVYPHLTVREGSELNDTEPQNLPPPNAYLIAVQAEKKGLEKQLEFVINERDDLRRRLDEETEERRRLTLLLTDQRNKKSWLARLLGS